MYMSDEQFGHLCDIIGFSRGPLTYTDFVEQFEDPRAGGPGDEIQRVPNHRYTHLPTASMSAEEVEALLKDKMRQAFGVRTASFSHPKFYFNLCITIPVTDCCKPGHSSF